MSETIESVPTSTPEPLAADHAQRMRDNVTASRVRAMTTTELLGFINQRKMKGTALVEFLEYLEACVNAQEQPAPRPERNMTDDGIPLADIPPLPKRNMTEDEYREFLNEYLEFLNRHMSCNSISLGGGAFQLAVKPAEWEDGVLKVAVGGPESDKDTADEDAEYAKNFVDHQPGEELRAYANIWKLSDEDFAELKRFAGEYELSEDDMVAVCYIAREYNLSRINAVEVRHVAEIGQCDHDDALVSLAFFRAYRQAADPVEFLRAYRKAVAGDFAAFLRAYHESEDSAAFLRAYFKAEDSAAFLRAHHESADSAAFLRARRTFK